MKRANLVLLSALLWLAWHLGTLSVPGIVVPGHPQESHESGIRPAVKRFAWESERLLGPTAQTVERDSGEIWREVDNSPSVKKWGSHQDSFSPATVQSGFMAAWRQIEPLMIRVRPIAQGGWGMIQSGWHHFMDGEKTESATATPGNPHANLRLPREHHAHSLQNERLAEQPD